MEVDLVVLGSGVSALISEYIALTKNRRVLTVDPDPVGGGSTASFNYMGIPYLRFPILLNDHDLEAISRVCGDTFNYVEIQELEPSIVKHGDHYRKVLGYMEGEYHRPWIYRWLESKRLYYCPNLYESLRNSLLKHNIRRHVVSDVRVIDIDRKILALSIGSIVKFKTIVYTWPLDKLRNIVRTTKKEVIEILNTITMHEPVKIHVLTLVVQADDLEPRLVFHGTKASRFHTFISIPLYHNLTVCYMMSSFSSRYPPLAGLTEKLYSEIKKFKLVQFDKIVAEHTSIAYHGILPVIPRDIMNKLKGMLEEHNIVLFGRLGLYEELSVGDILNNIDTLQSKL